MNTVGFKGSCHTCGKGISQHDEIVNWGECNECWDMSLLTYYEERRVKHTANKIIVVTLLAVAGSLALWGFILYIVFHFLAKFW